MRTYVAKSPHKRPCDLCGDAVRPGDHVATWAHVGEDGPGPSSNIIRCHATCHAIMNREQIDAFHLGRAFYVDEHEYGGPPLAEAQRWTPTKLKVEAEAALAAARVAAVEAAPAA